MTAIAKVKASKRKLKNHRDNWKNRALKAETELDDWRNAAKGAMEQRCEESHCACVPVLAARVRELERALQRMDDYIEGSLV